VGDSIPEAVGRHRDELFAEIEAAKKLLDAQADVGSEENLCTANTFDRAVEFRKTEDAWLWRSFAILQPNPTIGLGPHGSIDLYWDRPSWRLLVNVPTDGERFATFYWDDRNEQKTRGSFDPRKFPDSVAACLMR
jgi:hypothetical protein